LKSFPRFDHQVELSPGQRLLKLGLARGLDKLDPVKIRLQSLDGLLLSFLHSCGQV
jgi:hypothetical protein